MKINKTFKIKNSNMYFKILNQISSINVAIIGDIIVDEYIIGSCERISREAPVLILKQQDVRLSPGGAGNAILNAKVLNANVYAISVLNKNEISNNILSILKKHNVNLKYIVYDKSYNTSVKTRVLSGAFHTTLQQVIRIDRGGDIPISNITSDKLLENIKKIISKIDAVLISDYNLGIFTDYFCYNLQELLDEERKKRNLIVVVDSRYKLFNFKNAYIATPNESEAQEASNIKIKDKNSLIECGKKLLDLTCNKTMLITRGSQGMAFFNENKRLYEIPITRNDEIADVTGAGDTVAAVLVTTLPITTKINKPILSVELANIAAGIKVMKRGTAAISNDEIKNEIKKLDIL